MTVEQFRALPEPLEFWLVDPKRKTVKISTPDRKSITYIEGERRFR